MKFAGHICLGGIAFFWAAAVFGCNLLLCCVGIGVACLAGIIASTERKKPDHRTAKEIARDVMRKYQEQP